MYELIQLTEHDYYIDCPAKLGLVRVSDGEAVLIDSGSDKDAGKKAWRILQEKGWILRAICNTHSHADHIGGNRFLQEKSGCPIYARGLEAVYAAAPILEPIGLYGGLPFKELRSKFLLAQESRVLPLTAETLPAGFRLLDLPGHCFEMAGFLTPDGTAYIADSVSSAETLEKYGVGYLWDLDASIRTLEELPEIGAARYVPSHAPVTEDIRPLAALNRDRLLALRAFILEACGEPVTFERLLKELFDRYGMAMNAQQYALIGSTLRSCLSSLCTAGALGFDFGGNEMRWQRKE